MSAESPPSSPVAGIKSTRQQDAGSGRYPTLPVAWLQRDAVEMGNNLAVPFGNPGMLLASFTPQRQACQANSRMIFAHFGIQRRQRRDTLALESKVATGSQPFE